MLVYLAQACVSVSLLLHRALLVTSLCSTHIACPQHLILNTTFRRPSWRSVSLCKHHWLACQLLVLPESCWSQVKPFFQQ